MPKTTFIESIEEMIAKFDEEYQILTNGEFGKISKWPEVTQLTKHLKNRKKSRDEMFSKWWDDDSNRMKFHYHRESGREFFNKIYDMAMVASLDHDIEPHAEMSKIFALYGVGGGKPSTLSHMDQDGKEVEDDMTFSGELVCNIEELIIITEEKYQK